MTKPDAVREPMTNIATDVIEGYKTGLAGGPMGFVSAAFDCGWLTGAHERAALSEQPEASDWAGEEWERLAWHLCAEESGEEACNELVWEGGPIPEPWGDRWMKYEGEAKRMIAMVRQHVAHSAPVERVTLSDEQIDSLHCDHVRIVGDQIVGLHDFARVVIAEYERLSGISATPRQPLSEARIEEGRHETFSTNNPFCPCDSKTMLKAVRWAERAHGITPAQGNGGE